MGVKFKSSVDGIATLGFKGFAEDPRGFLAEAHRLKRFGDHDSGHYEWRPIVKRVPRNPSQSERPINSKKIMELTLPAIRHPENRGKRIFPALADSPEFAYRPHMKMTLDDKNPELLRRDRPAIELSLESFFTRKRRIDAPKSAVPRIAAEYDLDFFKGGGLVPGSSFMFQGKHDSFNRLNDGWKKFVPERSSTLRTYSERLKEKTQADLAAEVQTLENWETQILKEYPEAKFVDPDEGDNDD